MAKKVVEEDMVVTIQYTLSEEDGSVLDSSEENGDLDYLHGYEGVMPGLEKALEGKGIGESIDVTLTGDDAYGSYDESLLFTVSQGEFPDDVVIEEGLEFEAEIKDELRYCTVEKITEDGMVHINANHPLAGKTLRVQAKILEIRGASEEELDHGHVHSHGNHRD